VVINNITHMQLAPRRYVGLHKEVEMNICCLVRRQVPAQAAVSSLRLTYSSGKLE
jgi:hypothetical protein